MLICLGFLSDHFVTEFVLLFFIEEMSSLIPLLNKPVHITRWEWKGICYLFYACVRACVLNCFSRVRLFATLWTIAHQAPLSMGIPQQKYQSWLPCPPPGNLPDPGIKPHVSYVSCIGSQVLYHQHHLGSPICYTTSLSSLKFSEIYDKHHIVIYYPFFSMICQITAQLGPPSVVLEADLGNYLQSYLLPSQSHLLYQHLHNTSNCPFVSQMFF